MINPFVFDRSNMSIVTPHHSVPTNAVWLCAKPCALVMGYKNTKKAIIDHVDEDWQMHLSRLLIQGKSRGNGQQLLCSFLAKP